MMKSIFITALFILVPTTLFAATVSIEVDAGQATINVLEGTVRLPAGLKVEEIRTGGSALLFWIDEPDYDEASRSIYFAGTTPGGFAGRRELFTITGDFDAGLADSIWFSGVQALRNDGEGSKATVRLRAVAKADIGSDVIPPEPLYIEVGKSQDLFGGGVFVSFVTQDKGSGIERYEVAESFMVRPGEEDWQETVSPYEVKDKTLLKKVYVRAIDRDGNERVGTVGLTYRPYPIWFTAILIVAVCLIYVRRSRARA
jgi:hypothetical protein